MPDAAAPANPITGSPARLLSPQLRLCGGIEEPLYCSFREQLDRCIGEEESELVVELTTFGGDAELGRRIADDIRLAAAYRGKQMWFVGRTAVYSAGATIMAAFPRERRCLSADCVLMVHERRLPQEAQLDGALESVRRELGRLASQVEIGLFLQKQGYADLIAGSDVTMEEIARKAELNWYIPAQEALERRLVQKVF